MTTKKIDPQGYADALATALKWRKSNLKPVVRWRWTTDRGLMAEYSGNLEDDNPLAFKEIHLALRNAGRESRKSQCNT